MYEDTNNSICYLIAVGNVEVFLELVLILYNLFTSIISVLKVLKNTRNCNLRKYNILNKDKE